MKTIRLLFAMGSVLCAATASAQWQSPSYTLKGGWNAIYLHGEASHATLDELFPNSGDAANVLEVWRWNPAPDQVQFTSTPLLPAPGPPEWNVWVRGGASNLANMAGQAGYLIKCSGTAANSYSVSIPQRPLPPSATWVRHGANLLGFPAKTAGGNPKFSAYFATFPAAIAANTQIFKYIGGDLGPGNPLQIFSPVAETLDRHQAYWFSAEVVGDFYAPLEISLTNPAGLDFGRTASVITARLRNRTAATVTITLTESPSGAVPSVPAGLTPIEGVVPLTLGGLPISAGNGNHIVVIAPQSSVELDFGIHRGLMTGAAGALHASLLKFTDSSSLIDIDLPVRANVGSLAGLWIGEASVTNVVSKVATSPGSTTARAYPLRMIMHVDDSGKTRLLSQVFLGTLNEAGDPQGLCLQESQLKPGSKASALRFSVAHMPLDRAIDDTGSGNSGNVALGAAMVRSLFLDYREGTNPFVHLYHPDHDNKDARPDGTSTPKAEGEESFSVTRQCTFDFASTAPPGVTGWGAQVIGGTYSETLTGLHKETIQVSGTFELRRVSEIGSITTTTVANP